MKSRPPIAEPARPPPGAPEDSLARSLTGELPCIRCRYQLRGLSIRSVCPECGLPVRATLLAAVDPAANELLRLPRPRLLVAALMTWSAAGALSLIAAWVLFGFEIAAAYGFSTSGLRERVLSVALGGIACSGLGAAFLVFPTAETPIRHRLLATLAVTAYVPLAALFWSIQTRIGDTILPGTFIELGRVDAERSVLRIAMGVMLIAIFEGLRPNLRMLAARSLVMRTGRVDRQSMHALTAAILIVMGGDLLHLCGSAIAGLPRDVIWVAGAFLVAMGSLFFAAGVLGVVRDCIRVSAVLLEPAPSLESVLGSAAEPGLEDERPR